MEQFIGCDAHQKFSLFIAMNQEGQYGKPIRIAHDRERMREFLEALPAGSKIALETSGSYYWLVDEMERAGHQAQLAHALTAKRRMEGRHKTDERDARGLAMLLRNGTLPRVWIPPAELRDQREMLRWRMCLVESRSQIKNRIHGVLLRYNVEARASDLYGAAGRAELHDLLAALPEWTRQSVSEQLETIDRLDRQIEDCEQKLEALLEASAERSAQNDAWRGADPQRRDCAGDRRQRPLPERAKPGQLCRIGAGGARKRRQKAQGKMPGRLQHVFELGFYRGRQRGRGAS